MMLAWHTLTYLGMSRDNVDEMLDQARSEHYQRIRAFFHSQEDYEHPEHFHHLHSIEVAEGSGAIGKTLNSFEFSSHARVVALVRHGIRVELPEPETLLMAEDVLIIEGSSNETRAAELEIYRAKKYA